MPADGHGLHSLDHSRPVAHGLQGRPDDYSRPSKLQLLCCIFCANYEGSNGLEHSNLPRFDKSQACDQHALHTMPWLPIHLSKLGCHSNMI